MSAKQLSIPTGTGLRCACVPARTRKALRSQTRLAAVSRNQEAPNTTKAYDPYMAAASRLQSLINGVGDGEDELYYNMLREEDPSNKLTVNAVLGGILLTASTIICWLCDADPAGGASFSLHSLQAAALGALAAIPLVTYKLNFWSPDTKQQNPTVSALHKALIDNAKPWIQGMTSGQMAVHVVLDTLPVLFLMLPAAQAGLTASFAWSSAAIGRSVGLDLPQEVGFGIALLMTAVVTAGVRSTELMADPQQVDIVSEAVANADRYYRLTTSSSSGSPETDAQKAATAFKAVAVCWREQEQQLTTLFAQLQVLDFIYLGVLWYATKDMTAPCVAALLANGVDYFEMWKSMNGGVGGSNPGGSSGGSQQQQQQRQQQQQQRKQRDSSTQRE